MPTKKASGGWVRLRGVTCVVAWRARIQGALQAHNLAFNFLTPFNRYLDTNRIKKRPFRNSKIYLKQNVIYYIIL